jgi:hypothetical protein
LIEHCQHFFWPPVSNEHGMYYFEAPLLEHHDISLQWVVDYFFKLNSTRSTMPGNITIYLYQQLCISEYRIFFYRFVTRVLFNSWLHFITCDVLPHSSPFLTGSAPRTTTHVWSTHDTAIWGTNFMQLSGRVAPMQRRMWIVRHSSYV